MKDKEEKEKELVILKLEKAIDLKDNENFEIRSNILS